MEVEWLDSALNQLADILVASGLDQQDEIERAALHINRLLARDPWDLGESRATDTRRAWFVPPLFILFEIFADQQRVSVQHVAALPGA